MSNFGFGHHPSEALPPGTSDEQSASNQLPPAAVYATNVNYDETSANDQDSVWAAQQNTFPDAPVGYPTHDPSSHTAAQPNSFDVGVVGYWFDNSSSSTAAQSQTGPSFQPNMLPSLSNFPNPFPDAPVGYPTRDPFCYTAAQPNTFPDGPAGSPGQDPSSCTGDMMASSHKQDRAKSRAQSIFQPQMDTSQQENRLIIGPTTLEIHVVGTGTQLTEFEVQVIYFLVRHLTGSYGHLLSESDMDKTIQYMLSPTERFPTNLVIEHLSSPPELGGPHDSHVKRVADSVEAFQSFFIACACEVYSRSLVNYDPQNPNPSPKKFKSEQWIWRKGLELDIKLHVERVQILHPQQSIDERFGDLAVTSDGEPDDSAESAAPPDEGSQHIAPDIMQWSPSCGNSKIDQPLSAEHPTEGGENHPPHPQDPSSRASSPATFSETGVTWTAGQRPPCPWSPSVSSPGGITDAMLDEAFDAMPAGSKRRRSF